MSSKEEDITIQNKEVEAGLYTSVEDFNYGNEHFPRPTIEVIVKVEGQGWLLLKREGDQFDGLWHFPGGFMQKGHTFRAAAAFILERELGISDYVLPEKDYCISIQNLSGDQRAHLLHHLFEIKVSAEDKKVFMDRIDAGKIEFFTKLPENTVSFHKQFVNYLES